MLGRLVRQLREAGFEHIRLVTGYGAERIEKFNRDRRLGLELIYNPEWERSAPESLRCGIKDLNDDALIVFGDVLANIQIFRVFLGCEAPLAYIKTIVPWGSGAELPNDEVTNPNRQVCIVKVAKEKLMIFEKEKADKYLTQFAKRYCKGVREEEGSGLTRLLLEAMYQNGPVEEIISPVPIRDVDYFYETDEGYLKTPPRARPPKHELFWKK